MIALDVGHNQLHWRLRNNPRVTVIEGLNARRLTRSDLPDLGSPITRVSIDVSFISLRLIFPALPHLVDASGDIVPLVKPQFEAGREDVGKHGLVTDPAVHHAVLERVTTEAAAHGLQRINMTPSPITGATGNQEFFLHLRMRP